MSSYYTLEKDAIKLQRSELSDPYRIRNKYSHGFKTFLFIYLATCSLWDFSSPKAEVVKVLVAQLCPTLFDPMDHSPRGSSVWGISQVRILEWVAIFSSRGSSQPRDLLHWQADSLPLCHLGRPNIPSDLKISFWNEKDSRITLGEFKELLFPSIPDGVDPKLKAEIWWMGSERHFFSFESAMVWGSSSEQTPSFLSAAAAYLPVLGVGCVSGRCGDCICPLYR